MTADTTPRAVVETFLKLMTTGEDAQRLQALDLFAEDATLWIAGSLPYSGTRNGKAEIIEKVYSRAPGRMVPGSKSLWIRNIVAEGNQVVAEWTSRRTTKDGKDYQNDLCGVFVIENGKIKVMREYLDTLHAKMMQWPNEETKPA